MISLLAKVVRKETKAFVGFVGFSGTVELHWGEPVERESEEGGINFPCWGV